MAPRMTRRGFIAGVIGAAGVAALGKPVASEPDALPTIEPRKVCRITEIDYKSGVMTVVCENQTMPSAYDGWEIRDVTMSFNGVGLASTSTLVRRQESRFEGVAHRNNSFLLADGESRHSIWQEY